MFLVEEKNQKATMLRQDSALAFFYVVAIRANLSTSGAKSRKKHDVTKGWFRLNQNN